MKAKVIYGGNYKESTEKLDGFIKDKRVRDIKFQVNYVEDEAHYSFLIMYDDPDE